VLLCALYWRGLTSRGIIAGSIIGLITSITFIILGQDVWVSVLGNAKPIFPYIYPTVVTVPVAFIAIWFFSITDKSAKAAHERDSFDEQMIRSEIGLDFE